MKKPRLQSGVVPYYYLDGKLKIVLIRTKRKDNWGIPKGGIEPDMSPESSAKKEAFEEAGLSGMIVGPKLGRYHYVKGKTGRDQTVTVFAMQVDKMAKVYNEVEWREREAMSPKKALKRLEKKQKKMLKELLRRLGHNA